MTNRYLPPRPLDLSEMGEQRVLQALGVVLTPYFNSLETGDSEGFVGRDIEIRIPYAEFVAAPPTVRITGNLQVNCHLSSEQYDPETLQSTSDYTKWLRDRILQRVAGQLQELLHAPGYSFNSLVALEATVKLENNRQVTLKSSIYLKIASEDKPRITLVSSHGRVRFFSSETVSFSLTALKEMDLSKYEIVSHLPSDLEETVKQILGVEMTHRESAQWEAPINAYGDKIVVVSKPYEEVLERYDSQQQFYEQHPMTVVYMGEVVRPYYK